MGKTDGGPAFPIIGGTAEYHYGMSLRAYIATAALQGIVAGTSMWSHDEDDTACADAAVRLADALLAELAK